MSLIVRGAVKSVLVEWIHRGHAVYAQINFRYTEDAVRGELTQSL
jgi:hypothetical protein